VRAEHQSTAIFFERAFRGGEGRGTEREREESMNQLTSSTKDSFADTREERGRGRRAE
jgi:hypothetical protein